MSWLFSFLSRSPPNPARDYRSVSTKSSLELMAQLPFELMLRLLPGRDLARLACVSWTLFNRTLNDAVWHALFDDYLMTLPFVLVYSDALPTFRERMLRSRKLISLRVALTEALDGDVVRVPMGVFETEMPVAVVRTRIVLQGTRLELVRGQWQVHHRRHSVHFSRHFRDSATFLTGWQGDVDRLDQIAAQSVDSSAAAAAAAAASSSSQFLRSVSSSSHDATAATMTLGRTPSDDEQALLRSLPAWTPSSNFSPISYVDIRTLVNSAEDESYLSDFDDLRVKRMARLVINEIAGPLRDFITSTLQLDSIQLVKQRRSIQANLNVLSARVSARLRMLTPPTLPALQSTIGDADRLEDALGSAISRSLSELGRSVVPLVDAIQRACAAHDVPEPTITVAPIFNRRLYGRRRWRYRMAAVASPLATDTEYAAAAAPTALAGQLFEEHIDGNAMDFLNSATRGPTRLFSMVVGSVAVVDGVGFAAIDIHFEPRGQPAITSDGSGSLEVTNCMFDGRQFRTSSAVTSAIHATASDTAPSRKFVRVSNCAFTLMEHGIVVFGASTTATIQDCVITRCRTRAVLTDGECQLTVLRCLLTRCNHGIDAQGARAAPDGRSESGARAAIALLRPAAVTAATAGIMVGANVNSNVDVTEMDAQRFVSALSAPTPPPINVFVSECVFEGCRTYGVYVRRAKALLSRCAIRGGDFGVLAFNAEVELARSDLCEQKSAVVVLDGSTLRARRSCFRGATAGAAMQGMSLSTMALRECLVVGSSAITLSNSFASAQRCVLAATANVAGAAHSLPPVARVHSASVLAADGASVLRSATINTALAEQQDLSRAVIDCTTARV